MATIKIPPSTTEVTVTIPDPVITGVTPPTTPTENQPPIVSISGGISIQITQGQSGQTILTANATDPENKALTILWEKTNGPGAIVSPSTRTTTVNGLTADTGVKVTVSDPEGLQASASVVIRVTVVAAGARNLGLESTFDGVAISGFNNIAVQKGQPWSNQQHDKSKDYAVSSSTKARAGTNSCRYELRPGDGVTSGSYRSEITGPSYGAKDDLYIGVSVFPEKTDGNISWIQLHQSESDGIPPFAMWISFDKKWGVVHTSTGKGGAGQAGNIYDWIGAVEFGVWSDFVIHIKLSNGSDGIIEVWKNGVAQVLASAKGTTYKGITGYANGPYLKAGVYAFDGIKSGQIVYLDEIRVGPSYKDVAV